MKIPLIFKSLFEIKKYSKKNAITSTLEVFLIKCELELKLRNGDFRVVRNIRFFFSAVFRGKEMKTFFSGRRESRFRAFWPRKVSKWRKNKGFRDR